MSLGDIGWGVAAVLFLVCLCLLWVIEKAYQTGISTGRLLELQRLYPDVVHAALTVDNPPVND